MINFQQDVEATEKALNTAKRWGAFGAFFTLGLWANDRRISDAERMHGEARNDALMLASLQSDINRLHEFLDVDIDENGVRVALCIFPDVALDGRQTYGPFWLSIRNTVLQRDHYECRHADGGCSGPLQIHHIRRLSKGGSNDLLNLLTLCRYHHGLEHPGNPSFRR